MQVALSANRHLGFKYISYVHKVSQSPLGKAEFDLGETGSNVDLGVRIQGLSSGTRYLLPRYRVDMNPKQYVEDNIEEVIASKETLTFQHVPLKNMIVIFIRLKNRRK
ncbi:hypothetical protein L4C37_20065 [Vibrio kagoshimensis]|uniref:hypothetical protein n=1 Tax=Vibrio kagoshimensis TaxID=2910244 RepID=UPI003D19E3B6